MLCVARTEKHARAFASEFTRTSEADAAAGGGDDGNFVFQSEVHSIPLKLLSPRSGRFENSPAVSAGLTWFDPKPLKRTTEMVWKQCTGDRSIVRFADSLWN